MAKSDPHRRVLCRPCCGERWSSIGEGCCNWILGSTEGQWTFLVAIAALQLLAGTAAWALTGGNDDVNGSFRASLWMSYTLFIDPGTQTGLSPDASLGHKLVVVFLSVIGFIFNLAVLGLVVDMIRDRLARWKEERGCTRATGHVLVLGWGEKTIFMITELLAADMKADMRPDKRCGCLGFCIRYCKPRGRRIVVLAERNYMDMKQDVKLLVSSRGVAGRISFRSGDPTDPTDLMKVSANAAKDILIMSAGSNRKLEQKAVQTLLALAALPRELDDNCNVFAEVRNSDTLEAVKPLLPANAEGILARDAVNQILIIRALMPPVGYCYMELASHHRRGLNKSSLYPLDVPDALVGVPFADACRHFPRAVICGIRPKQKRDGTFIGSVIPDKDSVLKPEDTLVLIASDAQAAACWEPASSRLSEPRPAMVHLEDVFSSDGQLKLGPLGHGDVPSNVLMLGCPSDLASFLTYLDKYLPMNSHVHILSRRSKESREWSLRRHFGRTSPSSARRLFTRPSGSSSLFHVIKMARAANEECDHSEDYFRRIQVTHHTGSPTEKKTLSKMPLATAHVCLILAEPQVDDEPAAVDSRNLTALILVRNLLKECGRDDLKKSGMPDRCKVLIELLDPRSRRVVEGNGDVRKLGSFLYSSAVEIGMFAQAVEEKSMYHFILQLLDATERTDQLVSYPLKYFVGTDALLSYWDLHTSIWNSIGGILLGWKRKGERYPVLNPSDKTDMLKWAASSEDQLLVLRPPSAQTCQETGLTALSTPSVAGSAVSVSDPVSDLVGNTLAVTSSNLPHCVPPLGPTLRTTVIQ